MKVQIQKNLELLDGEELGEFVGKLQDALAVNRAKLKLSLGIVGIFSDHILTKDFEKGGFYRFAFSRDESGSVVLGDGVEVRQVFVPVTEADKAIDTDEIEIEKQESIQEPINLWAGLLR